MSEADVAGRQAYLRQPASKHLRRWEVAGSSHLDFRARQGLDPLQARDLGSSSPRACTQLPFNRIPFYMVWNACPCRKLGTPCSRCASALGSVRLPIPMLALVVALLAALQSTTRSRAALAAEILALRHQLAVLRR